MQDMKVLEFYRNKTNGYFVEVGASDGIQLSNTYLLETKYGWKGVCCEPLPSKFDALVQNRPHCVCVKDAVYDQTGLNVTFDISHRSDMLSGITQHIDKHRSTVDENKTTITVSTITLLDVLDQAKAPAFIEYLSLDTEGSEYEILKAFDFSRYTFGLIDVEHNYIEPRRTHLRELLLRNGYEYLGENQFDDRYKHASVSNKIE
jgi:FkbM family methyltransferase